MYIAESDQTKPLPNQKEKLLKLIIEEVMNSHARPMFGLAVPKDERLKHVIPIFWRILLRKYLFKIGPTSFT